MCSFSKPVRFFLVRLPTSEVDTDALGTDATAFDTSSTLGKSMITFFLPCHMSEQHLDIIVRHALTERFTEHPAKLKRSNTMLRAINTEKELQTQPRPYVTDLFHPLDSACNKKSSLSIHQTVPVISYKWYVKLSLVTVGI